MSCTAEQDKSKKGEEQMDADAHPEAAEILEEAYERFLDAYRALEDEEQGDLNNPVMEKKFDRVDKYFRELVSYVNGAARRVPFSAGPTRATTKPQ
jgi:hypothetical protein